MRPIPTAMILLSIGVVLCSLVSWSSERICELASARRDRVDSTSCLACHDGSLAPAVHANIPSQSFEELSPTNPASDASHPVEVDYEAARMRRPSALTPSALLPPSLVMTNGKLTCGTCHDGRSREPGHVAMSLAGSKLCLTCHSGF